MTVQKEKHFTYLENFASDSDAATSIKIYDRLFKNSDP